MRSCHSEFAKNLRTVDDQELRAQGVEEIVSIIAVFKGKEMVLEEWVMDN